MRRRHLPAGLAGKPQGFDQPHRELKFKEVPWVPGKLTDQHQAADVAQRCDRHIGSVEPAMLLKALYRAFVQRRTQAQGNDDAHQGDAMRQGLGLQGICVQPVRGNPWAGAIDQQGAEHCHRQKDQFERAQQTAQTLFACRSVSLVRYGTHQAGRQTGIQQLQPGLQQGEETDQSIRFGTQVAQIERHDQNSDQQHVSLPAVIQEGVADEGVFAWHDGQQTRATGQAR